jgi:tetratricopeptide (TPR) repeat protein
MKLRLALFLACASLAWAADPPPATIPEALAAAERFATQGKWKEALEAGNRLRTLTQAEHGDDGAAMALAEMFLGEVRDHLGERLFAEAHFRRALALQEKAPQPDAAEIIATLTRLGACLKDQQRSDEAAGVFQRALDLQVRLKGSDDPDTAVATRNLARILRSKRDYPGAAALFEKALAIQRQGDGAHDPETLEGLRELAQTYELAGDVAAAERQSEERVTGTAAAFGEDSTELVAALSDWGRFAEAQEHFAAAEPRYRRALKIVETDFAHDEFLLADTLSLLGWCLRNLNRLDEAQPLLQRALELRDHSSGSEHVQTAQSCRLLGWVLRLKGELEPARGLFQRALAIREEALGPTAPATLESMDELGQLEWRRGDFDEATSVLEKRRYRVEQVSGPASEATATAWRGLALVYESARRWPQATDAALRSLRLHEKLFGPADSRTLNEMVLLSQICETAGAFGPALTQYARLADWFAQHPEASSQTRAEFLRQYAVATLRAGQPDAAGPLFLESRRTHETAFGPDEPPTLRSFADLWTYYDATRQPAFALETARELAIRSESRFGADAPETSAVCDRLGQLCLTLGDQVEALKWFRRALDGRRRHFGPASAELLDALGQVALWFEQVRDFPTAIALRNERLGVVRKRSGPDSAPLATACGELALAYFRAGDLASARGMFERQIELIEKRMGTGSLEALPALALLGDVTVAAHDRPGAIRARERLAASCRQQFGEAHRESGRALLLLGEALLAGGATDRAEATLRTAYPLVSEPVTPPDSALLRVSCALARISLHSGKLDEAKRWSRDTLKAAVPPEEALAEVVTQLGDEWLQAKNETLAEDCFEAALVILTQTLGDQDDHTVALLEKLARLRLGLNRPGTTALLERAFAGSEALYGTEAAATANLLGWLILARVREQQFSAAQADAQGLVQIIGDNPEMFAPELARQLTAWTGLLAAPPPEWPAALDQLTACMLDHWNWAEPMGSWITTAAGDAL